MIDNHTHVFAQAVVSLLEAEEILFDREQGADPLLIDLHKAASRYLFRKNRTSSGSEDPANPQPDREEVENAMVRLVDQAYTLATYLYPQGLPDRLKPLDHLAGSYLGTITDVVTDEDGISRVP